MGRSLNLRTLAILVLAVGAAASLGMMTYAGRHNKSVVLILMFVVWVLAPFAALIGVHLISKRWSTTMRTTLSYLSLIIAFTSVVAYSGILLPPGTKTAFIFLVMPVISWVIMIITFLIASAKSKNFSRKNIDDPH